GFSKRETEDALIDLQFLGIDNVLVLRGDAEKGQKTFVPEHNGNKQAIELLKQVVGLNNGIYLDKDIINGSKSNFCMGVSGYPEKHFEAPSMEFDLQKAKEKVDAGAQYIMTQMFFDNKKYFEYVDACRSIGINVPIIPGLKPITNKKQLTILPNIFYVDIPTDLSTAMLAATTDEACEQVGIEWLIQQSKELKAAGVPVLHYYTLGKPKVVKDVVAAVF
ncbi:MAG: methylenetetrahydrofolate reductase, partial [Sediminibacterium sp.]|nr:methylenetetrahydrofolate reductase [Sediminibacterium sp.]